MSIFSAIFETHAKIYMEENSNNKATVNMKLYTWGKTDTYSNGT